MRNKPTSGEWFLLLVWVPLWVGVAVINQALHALATLFRR